MKSKVILISIDGMRPDGLMQCKNPYVKTLMQEASYTLKARSAQPSVTLPCHMTMFHSVPPMRHGITTNTYIPQMRPVSGLFEQISMAGGNSAMFYGWEPLRDVARPGSLKNAVYRWAYAADNTDKYLTDRALECIERDHPDFVFLYMVETDEKGGHDHGWMSEEYLACVSNAIDQVRRVVEAVGEDYSVIVTADHGGHDRMHGTDMEEDMTIPMFYRGPAFEAGKELENVSLLEIAPTIADLLGAMPSPDWEGRSLTDVK